jgi:hypothetical protein
MITQIYRSLLLPVLKSDNSLYSEVPKVCVLHPEIQATLELTSKQHKKYDWQQIYNRS